MAPRKKRTLIVLGTMAGNPWAGMAWMHMQIAAGLARLGHEVYYFETTSAWPFLPQIQTTKACSDYAVPFLARVAESFGLAGRWAYRQSYSKDKRWFGLNGARAEELLANADAVFNVAGATRLAEEGLKAGRLVHFGTDPVAHEILFANGEPEIVRLIEEHCESVTYGENIGTPDCPVPPLPGLRSRTRQPVLLDLWQLGPAPRDAFTTVANWKQTGKDIVYQDETYYWSKHHEFLKFIELPERVNQPIELALALPHVDGCDRQLLEDHRWKVVDASVFTLDPWSYREYLRSSAAEFTIAKDQYRRLRSGWFSERSACYLAAGRPVITQDTGFGNVLPTGEGLFAFNSLEEIVEAFDMIRSDYGKHSRAARAIAEEYFRAETVLARVLDDLSL
jgi:hypothetical protein